MEDEFECYYLDGQKKGTIESSEFIFREGPESRTMFGSSRSQPKDSGEPLYYRYHIHEGGKTYCVASNLSQLDSQRLALTKALEAGLKPFP